MTGLGVFILVGPCSERAKVSNKNRNRNLYGQR